MISWYPTIQKVGLCLLLASGLILAGGCQKSEPKAKPERLTVVATTSILADTAKSIAGDKMDISGLMGPGVDPHLYQASAGDVEKLQKADIVLYHGLHLEGKMGDIFSALTESGKTVICLADGLDEEKLMYAEADVVDPHIWFDVPLWKDAAKWVADGFMAADPTNASYYGANFWEYARALDDLNRYVNDAAEAVPATQRVLITAHDAFQYFGRAYGFTVQGIQGISTAAEAGTGDISALADFIAGRKIKAVFVESSVPPKTIEALREAVAARGFSVNLGGQLYSDALGSPDTDAATYINMVRANVDTITHALR